MCTITEIETWGRRLHELALQSNALGLLLALRILALAGGYFACFGCHNFDIRAAQRCCQIVDRFSFINVIFTVDLANVRTGVSVCLRFGAIRLRALKYLSISATSAPSDSLFAGGKHLQPRRRASVSPVHLDALMFLSANDDLSNEWLTVRAQLESHKQAADC
jgi:hypothetical protein